VIRRRVYESPGPRASRGVTPNRAVKPDSGAATFVERVSMFERMGLSFCHAAPACITAHAPVGALNSAVVTA